MSVIECLLRRQLSYRQILYDFLVGLNVRRQHLDVKVTVFLELRFYL